MYQNYNQWLKYEGRKKERKTMTDKQLGENQKYECKYNKININLIVSEAQQSYALRFISQ